MARVLVTGSADGLGRLAAARLVDRGGHEVMLHARSEPRGREAVAAVPGAAGVLVGDLASIAQTRALAGAANESGPFDAVIHNAGTGYRGGDSATEDGLGATFAVNVLAPYLLTALMTRPRRLVYLSSGMHRGAGPDVAGMRSCGYSESKFWDVALAFAVARLWPEVSSNAVNPGWVPTKMGGPGAPDDLELGADTQVWLAVSEDPAAQVSGRLLHHRREQSPHPAAARADIQDALLAECAAITGVQLAT